MSPFLIPAVLFVALSFMLSVVVCGLMIKTGVGDQPDHRSSHKRVTPTAGGLAIVATIGVMSLLMAISPAWFKIGPLYAQMLSLIFAISFLGLMDDVLDLAAPFKFFLMVIISAAAVAAIGPVTHLPFGGKLQPLPIWFAWGGSILWVFVVTNIVNFMDGSNGLMLSVMGIACFFLAYLASIMGAGAPFLLLSIVTIAIGGLLFFNFRKRALIFSGDVGSLTIGFVFAVSVLWINREVPLAVPVYIGPVLIMPFLIDAFYTMYIRAVRKEKLIEPHKEHLYQRLIEHGRSHKSVAYIYAFATLLSGGYAVWVIQNGQYHFSGFPLIPAGIFSLIYIVLYRRFNGPG